MCCSGVCLLQNDGKMASTRVESETVVGGGFILREFGGVYLLLTQNFRIYPTILEQSEPRKQFILQDKED